jgi:hypothetical protein
MNLAGRPPSWGGWGRAFPAMLQRFMDEAG